MRADRAAVTARAAGQLRIAGIVGNALGPSISERLVTYGLCLAAASLLAVLVAGGYKLTAGPFRVSAHHLRNPVLLFLALILLKTWLRGARIGVPRAARLRSPSVLFLCAVFIYSLNGTNAMAGDTVPARFLPLSLLQEFDFDLDEFPFLYELQMPYFLQQIDGRIVSAYPPWAGVLALPVYTLPVFAGLDPQSYLLPELEKIAAALITALSVVILFCAVKRLTRENIAWGIAVVYALGTSSFSSSSQALFQHGPSQLFLSLMLYWLIRGLEEPRYSANAGFALAAAVICRPLNILIALPIGAYMLQQRRAQLSGFLLATLPPLLLFMAYNMRYFGAPLTSGFGATAMGPSFVLKTSSQLLSTPLFEGLMGVLVSPGRGLLIYSPIFILSFIGILKVWKESGHVLLKYLSLSVLFSLMLVAKWIHWWGGHSYGPRLLADITPILCLLLYPLFEWAGARRFAKFAFIGLSGLSISLHALGAFGGSTWNVTPVDVDQAPERLWLWMDSPPMYYAAEIIGKLRQIGTHLLRFVLAIPTSLDVSQQLATSYDVISPGPGPPWIYALGLPLDQGGIGGRCVSETAASTVGYLFG